MKKWMLILLALCLNASAAITITNVRVDSLHDTACSYGHVWKGFLQYDVQADTSAVWAWVELSTDNGATWSQRDVSAVGHVGSIVTGTARKVWWMVDGNKGPDCKLRVRVNSQPKYYLQTDPTNNVSERISQIYAGGPNPTDCPIPIPETDPYETVERMVNNSYHAMDLSTFGYNFYMLPMYAQDTWQQAWHNVIDITCATGTGELSVGMGVAGRPYSAAYNVTLHPELKYRATYIKVGSMEFAVISKNSIRGCYDSTELARQAIQTAMGIPRTQVLINWDHTHYTDNGESGADSCVAALQRAKAAAVPAEMAYSAKHMGPGFNYNRGYTSSTPYYTTGPVDEKLCAVFFRAVSNHALIGSWYRFAGHGVSIDGQVNLAVESRLGGLCAAMQGGGGTSNVHTSSVATTLGAPAATGLFSAAAVTDSLAAMLSSAAFQAPGFLGVATSEDNYPAISRTFNQAIRLGNVYIPVYTAEGPMEQQLYTMARMGSDMNVMPLSYSNSGCGIYYFWGRGGYMSAAYYRMAEAMVRCMNILSQN